MHDKLITMNNVQSACRISYFCACEKEFFMVHFCRKLDDFAEESILIWNTNCFTSNYSISTYSSRWRMSVEATTKSLRRGEGSGINTASQSQ